MEAASLWQRVMIVLVFSQLIEVQAEYHRKSLTLLQAVLPQIKAQQGKCQPPSELGGLGACALLDESSSPPVLSWECSHVFRRAGRPP